MSIPMNTMPKKSQTPVVPVGQESTKVGDKIVNPHFAKRGN